MATGGEGHGDARVDEGQHHIMIESPDLSSLHRNPTALSSTTPPDSVPHPRPRGKPKVKRVNTAGRPLVFFNVETTGFKRDRHITQIAARKDRHHKFNTFVRPSDFDSNFELPYAEEASGITITFEGMFHHGQPVEFLTIRPALEQFIHFLGQQKRPVVLVGHNIQAFGSRPLVKALQNCDLIERFQEVVHCFSDIYLLLKGKRQSKQEKYDMTTLYKRYTGKSLGPHDARKEVKALKQIKAKAGLRSKDLEDKSFTIEYIIEDLRHVQEKALSRWMILKKEGVITDYMVEQALKKGLEFDEVCRKFQDHGEEGARQLLKERLTEKEEITNKICAYLRQGVPE